LAVKKFILLFLIITQSLVVWPSVDSKCMKAA